MNVVLADDHVMFRECVRYTLECGGINVLSEASDGRETLHLVRTLCPQVVILDINMPGMNGLEVARSIKALGLDVLVVMLTMFDDDSSLLEALRAGASAYVLKSRAASELLLALQHISYGRPYLSQQVTGTLVAAYLRQQDDNDIRLTLRERQILQLVAEGNITKEIAGLLHLSVKTVESHRSQLMRKLKTGNIAGLVRHAVRQRVINC